MPVWSVASVGEKPEITLCRWKVIETERLERHFVGLSVASNTGRVSSAIQSFDPETRTGVTRSGRRYVLLGAPGDDPDGMHTWAVWARVNDVKEETDVSSEYLPEAQSL
jgi:hypothetical protein